MKTQKIDLKEISEIIFLINENTKLQDIQLLPKDKLRIALPVICRDVKKFLPIIENLLQQGFKKWEIGNYWGLEVLSDKNIDLSFDNMIYMFNTQAVQKAKEIGEKGYIKGKQEFDYRILSDKMYNFFTTIK